MDNEIELILGMMKEFFQPSWKEVWRDIYTREKCNLEFKVYFNSEKGLAIMEMEEYRREYPTTIKKEVYFVTEYTDAILLGQKLFPIWVEEFESV